MTKKQKQTLIRIIITAVLFFALLVLGYVGIIEKIPYNIVLYLIPYAIIGYDIFLKAFHNIKGGDIFDENLLMLIATIAAFAIGEYTEGLAVMFLYQIGELFQSYAVGKSRNSISSLMDMVSEYANLYIDGEIEKVSPDDVEVGSIIVIKPGERVPLDAVVIDGTSMVDTSSLTGESVPRRVNVGDDIISGCINGSGTIKAQVTKSFENSTVSRILELVENASDKKAKTENFITRFARVYTPAVTIAAVLVAVIPPVILGYPFDEWLERACIFLVISCPCALVISVPLGFFGGIGAASRRGILVKGSNYLEAVSKLDTVVFDKTGTLTKGEFKVTEIIANDCSKEKLIEIAAHAESLSNHPIANSITNSFGGEIKSDVVTDYHEIAGNGVEAFIDGKRVLCGNEKLMKSNSIQYKSVMTSGTVVYVAYDGKFLGSIVISDVIKENAKESISRIKQNGVKKCVMLTGDHKSVADDVASKIGIDEVYAELLPLDKVEAVEKLLKDENDDNKLAFAGDGINDAPVLSRADVGFAMGSIGSDAAIEAADIVIMDDDIGKIADTVSISRKTMRIVKENIVFALGVKAIVMVLGVFGIANMWLAVFADVGVSVSAILNSMRMLKK